MNVGEFFISLGFDGDTSPLKSFQGGLKGLGNELMSVKNLFIGGALYGMEKFVSSTVDSVKSLQNFGMQTDLSIEKLQKWQVAGQLSGAAISVDQMTSSIQGLQKNLTDIKLGAGNIKGFQMLGIDVQGKDAFEVLENIRESIKGLDNQTAVNLIEQTGLNPAFINVLRMSEQEFSGIGKVKFLTSEQRKAVQDFGIDIEKFKLECKLSKDALVADLVPALKDMLDFVSNLARGLSDLISSIVHCETAFKLLGIVAAAIAAYFFPIQAAILVLLLVIEDFYTYLKGGDSWIGGFINMMKSFGQSITNFLLEPLKYLLEVGNKVKDFFTSDFVGVKNAISSGLDAVKGIFGLGENKEAEGIKPGNKIVNLNEQRMFDVTSEAERSIQPMNTSNATTNNKNASFSNTYNIHSTEKPEDVAQSIADMQQRQLNYAYQDLNNGASF